MVPVVIRNCMTARDLNHHMGPGWNPETMLLMGPSTVSERPAPPPEAMVTYRPKLLPMIRSGFIVLWQLGPMQTKY